MQWDDLLQWLLANMGDRSRITATSPDSAPQSRVNMLASLAGFRPAQGGSYAHRAAANIIVRVFYEEGLINMKVGKSSETALLKAVVTGNFEIAALLLEFGAGKTPLGYSLGSLSGTCALAGGHAL